MGKISELPKLERPREKALYYGIEKLSDYELLALLIGSGSKAHSAIDIAYAMLSDSRGLFNLVQKPTFDLLQYHGMGEKKAIKIEAAFEIARRFQNLKNDGEDKVENSQAIFLKYRHKLLVSNSIQEKMFLVILDKSGRVKHEMNIYVGNENSIRCSSRQIIQQVILHSGSSFYIIHNHPSGILSPSEDDILFTMSVINECKRLDINMVDHLIICHKGYYSFLDQQPHLVGN